MSDRPLKIAVNEVRLETWRAALVAAAGNITRAAMAVGIGHAWATKLNTKFELKEFAAKLRLEAGGTRTVAGERKGVVAGRPRKK
ncbi:MAG: hypothetical protein V4550_18245 [Gemmatimonadota bacterium]